jgi:hypothetical protein
MSVLSVTCCSLFSAICAFTLVNAAGCGTDAQGVDDCRDIEQARCAAAKSCGIVEDVDACQRFYRDQCLHGLAVSPPSSTMLKACLATIHQAGMCAASDAGTELSDCTDVTQSAPRAKKACDLVTNPEYAEECSFLAPAEDAGTVSSGGTSGASEGGSSGSEEAAGSAGTSGAAGT